MEFVIVAGMVLLGKELSKNKSEKVKEIEVMCDERIIRESDDDINYQDFNELTQMPFFKSVKSQNTNDNYKDNKLSSYTGTDELFFKKKKEVENTNIAKDLAYGTPFGVQNKEETREDQLNRFKESIDNNNWMNNVTPVEKQYVGPGLNIGSEESAKGGFHDTFRILPNNVNSYKKNSYENRVIPGKTLNESRVSSVSVDKNRPERYYCGDQRQVLPTQWETKAQSRRSEIIMNEENTNICNEFIGGPNMQSGSFLDPSTSYGSRTYDSTKCNINLNGPSNTNVNGSYVGETYIMNESDREQSINPSNVHVNTKSNVMYNSQGTNATQRGNGYKYNGVGPSLGNYGNYNNNVQVNVGQRETYKNGYEGNPHMISASENREYSVNNTQRGNMSNYSAPAKSYIVGDINKYMLNNTEFNNNKDTRSYVGCGGNMNVREDANKIMNNMCIKPDENCYELRTHASQKTNNYTKINMETKVGVNNVNNRNDFGFISKQLNNNDYSIRPFTN